MNARCQELRPFVGLECGAPEAGWALGGCRAAAGRTLDLCSGWECRPPRAHLSRLYNSTNWHLSALKAARVLQVSRIMFMMNAMVGRRAHLGGRPPRAGATGRAVSAELGAVCPLCRRARTGRSCAYIVVVAPLMLLLLLLTLQPAAARQYLLAQPVNRSKCNIVLADEPSSLVNQRERWQS